MNIRTNTHGMELTPAISSYIEKKLVAVGRLLQDVPPETLIEVDIAKDSKQHKGKVFKAEMIVFLPSKRLFASAEDDDMYAAIDEVKDEILSEIKKLNVKRRDIARRSAARVKRLFQQVGAYFIPRKKSR